MNIALVGYGKMGKMIEKIALDRGHNISFIIDINNINDIDKLSPSNTDVVIEFTQPESAFNNVSKCLSKKVNVVCGTTGWKENLNKANEIATANDVGFLWSSNFSIGVNVFFKLNEYLAQLMNKFNNYEPSIKEIHHIHKKDAPSGTAITLAEGILKNYNHKKMWELNAETPENLNITAERTGEVPGTHIIKYDSDVDYIEITHCAKSRQGFALGAVIAAEFLKGKKGIFTMNHVLGF